MRGGDSIFSKFLKLDNEKQQRILNAAMKEFALKGFKSASTDTIVKEAKISKGGLFHYFNNKKDLFLFLYDYSLEIVKNSILLKFNFDEKDIFARRRQALLLKIEVLNKHPEMYDFLAVAYMEDSSDVKNDLEGRNKVAVAGGQGMLNEGIDTSNFKEGIDTKKAIEIISWTIDGFNNKEMERIKRISLHEIDYYEMLKELDIYLDMLKKCFYK
jgi:AcrR family transcriptional regulator